jgi:hypothetical protein
MIAAASSGPKPPTTSRTVPSVPPARRDRSHNGHEIAYVTAKNTINGVAEPRYQRRLGQPRS